MIDAVVMAAGLGTRLRPISDDVAKAVLPIDGRPVVASLVRELAAARCPRATIVTGHLADQVEGLLGDGAAWGMELRFVRQPSPDGSADAVRRAGLEPPYLVCAADTLFAAGDVARFAASGRSAAIAVRRHSGKHATRVEDGRVTRVLDRAGSGPWTGAPLWLVDAAVHEGLCLDAPPYELGSAFQRAIDAGHDVLAVEIGPTRDLTRPLDVVRENFPYLEAIR